MFRVKWGQSYNERLALRTGYIVRTQVMLTWKRVHFKSNFTKAKNITLVYCPIIPITALLVFLRLLLLQRAMSLCLRPLPLSPSGTTSLFGSNFQYFCPQAFPIFQKSSIYMPISVLWEPQSHLCKLHEAACLLKEFWKAPREKNPPTSPDAPGATNPKQGCLPCVSHGCN